MSNQALLWAMLVVPWLSLFFMKKQDIIRYIPAGLFSSFLLTITQEVGVANGWWYFRETIYPFAVFTPFTESVDLIIPMWVLKYTYGRFWLYLLIEIIGNGVSMYVIFPWIASRRIMDWPVSTELIAFTLVMVIALLVYGFQMWQEGAFGRSEKTEASVVLQPAAMKPNQDDNPDE